MRFLNFGRVVDTTVLRTEFGYTPRHTTAEALADYARTVPPVVPPALVGDLAGRAEDLVHRAGSVASTVGTTVHGRLRPAPAPPGLRAVRDA